MNRAPAHRLRPGSVLAAVALFAAVVVGLALPRRTSRPATPLETARSYLAADRAGDFDACFDLLSEGARNLWRVTPEELRLPPKDRDVPLGAGKWFDYVASLVPAREAKSLSPRALFRASWAAERRADGPGALAERPTGDVEVRYHGTQARVTFEHPGFTVFLVPDGGVWRVVGIRVPKDTGVATIDRAVIRGKKVTFLVLTDMVLSPLCADVSLPRLPARASLDSPRTQALVIEVLANGTLKIKGKVGTAAEFLPTISKYAGFARNLASEQQESLVHAVVGFDRKFPWSKAEALLRLLAGSEVRIRYCDVLSTPSKFLPVGVPFTLERAGNPRVRQPPPGPELSVFGPVDAATFRGLVQQILSLPHSRLAHGLRVSFPANLSVEDAFSFLVRLRGYVAGPIRVSVAPPGSPSGVRLMGKAVTPRPGPLPPPTARSIRLVLPW